MGTGKRGAAGGRGLYTVSPAAGAERSSQLRPASKGPGTVKGVGAGERGGTGEKEGGGAGHRAKFQVQGRLTVRRGEAPGRGGGGGAEGIRWKGPPPNRAHESQQLAGEEK
ncbi:unnamed protein product [Calypogeia fissa]